MKNYLLIILLTAAVALTGCVNFTTRVEKDIYTITVRDTTNLYEQKNAPGNRDNGIVFPSSRTITSERELIQRDSIIEREFPDFIRIGAYESIGTIGMNPDSGLGSGLFGLFSMFNDNGLLNLSNADSSFRGGKYVFSGVINRLLIGEWRLRWFRDAENWTLGTSLYENITPDARIENTLGSFLPLYIRKRWFISEDIPYLSLTGSFGIGYYPSQYINASASLDFGSIGGLNLRAYAGVAAGYNAKGNMILTGTPFENESKTVLAPYLGLGISFLDFHNRVEETKQEWKDMKNSAWNIGLAQVSFLWTPADSAAGDAGGGLLKGMMIKLLNSSLALPFANNQFFAGVSLANIISLGKDSYGVSMLPVTVGYWQTLLEDELSTTPFVEFGFYPTSYFHVGNRLNLVLTQFINLGVVLGYISGSTSDALGDALSQPFGSPGKLSQFYVGLSLGLGDRIFYPQDLRYNK
jgi:hypothetical protein